MNTRKQLLDLDSVLPLATKRSLQESPQHSKPSVYDVHGLRENPPARGFSHWQCVEMPICLGGCPIAMLGLMLCADSVPTLQGVDNHSHNNFWGHCRWNCSSKKTARTGIHALNMSQHWWWFNCDTSNGDMEWHIYIWLTWSPSNTIQPLKSLNSSQS